MLAKTPTSDTFIFAGLVYWFIMLVFQTREKSLILLIGTKFTKVIV